MPTKTFPAQFEYLDPIRDFVGEAALQAGMDEKGIYNVQLAADEAASNIIEHAYAGIPDGQIDVTTEVTREALKIILHDTGKRFEVDEVQEPDIEAGLEDRAIGGLGLFFMRKLMDVVDFHYTPESGNTLTMLKYLGAGEKTPKKKRAGRADLFLLGEQILAATTFAEQRNLIIETASRLVEGEVSLWLNELFFRLPDWVERVFPDEPPSMVMRAAHATGRVIRKQVEGSSSVAFPLHYEETGLGVVEVRCIDGKKISRSESALLMGLARAASIGLIAWHRITVERWRLGQLSLVRTVSAQIAHEPDIDQLARKVTSLISTTFKYYYVAIFTLEAGKARLNLRSSMGGATRRKGRPMALSFQVDLGQGLVGSAAQTGEELIANDVQAEPRFRHVDRLPETQSEAAIPIKVEERVLGVLDVQSDKLSAFHPYDLMVLRALADNIAVAIEGAHLYSDLRRRADSLNVVAEVSKQITSFLNLRELMQEVAAIIHNQFKYPYVHLFTVHPNRRQIHYEAGSGARSAALEGYVMDLDDPEGLVAWVARHGETVLANDVEQEPRYRPSPLPPANTRSELTVPLVFNSVVYGVLDVQSDETDTFTEDDRRLFETLADAIASAIRNADLYRSEQWRRQVGDSLREVAVLLSANASLDQVMEAILTELDRNLPADVSAIWLLDEDNIYCAAVHGARPGDLEQARNDYPEASAWLATALLARQPLVRKPLDPMGPAALSSGFSTEHSAIAVPLRIGEQSVGVLTLAHHTPGRYGHEAQAMTTTFASYAAVAIENARLYDSAQEQAYASAALLQVAQAVVSLSDLDEILGTIVRVMPILVGVERAAIYLWDFEANLLRPAQEYGIPEETKPLLWRTFQVDEFPLLAAAIDQGQMVLCQDAHLGPENWLQTCPCSPEELEAVTYSDDRLLAALPLAVKGEIFGVLLVEEAIGGRRFRSRRLEILTGIAQQIALAIQNDLFQQETVARERLEMEVHLARQIQETFIPEILPQPPGWDISARWRTARQVGGDFYDVFELPNQRLGLFIADVADKGMPAALFMALTRTLVRAAVLRTDSPAQALSQVNDLLYPDCRQGMFVTAVYGVLEPATGKFTYTNAGHNPPLWVRRSPLPKSGKGSGVRDETGKGPGLRAESGPTDAIERLTRTGIALGVKEHAIMEERSLDLAPGDTLFFYTDGVTEAFSADDEMYGEDRLTQGIAASQAETAEDLLDEIDAAVNAFIADYPMSDDMTMVAVRRQK